VGVACAALLYLAAAIFSATTLPWKGTADSFAHMDYVYQVHRGHVPDAYGYEYRQETPDNSRQWASAHPPLFYALAATVMGRPLDAGNWQVAVIRGRALNILIGLASVLALAWAGWEFGGDRRAALAIALPAIGGMLPIFVRFCGDIYNDPLATLLSIAAVVMSCKIVRDGATARRALGLGVLCALGMASRATFVFALVIALCALAADAVMATSQGGLPGRVFRAAASCVVIATAAILPTAWFYERNYELSGSWFRTVAKHSMQARPRQSPLDVLGSDDFWLLVPRNLLGSKWRSTWPVNDDLSMALFIACGVGLVVIIAGRRPWRSNLALDRRMMVWLLIAAHFAGLLAAQFQHAIGWGALNFRYFLPALLSIGLFLAIPAVFWRTFSASLTTALSGLMAFSCLMGSVSYLDARYSALARGHGSVDRLFAAVHANGLSGVWIWATLSAMAIALAGIAFSVSRVQRPRLAHRPAPSPDGPSLPGA
jgi:hypothetical protein